ncbi:hypothetical protein [Niveibacterium sp. SC-1]|uniref:hypothetical protein n=1 Tax=Niveibacterium sp. SC-1 TaxID=3135646 RepID=UPI00311E6373
MSSALPRHGLSTPTATTEQASAPAATASAASVSAVARPWMLAAVFYLLAGVSLGFYMGISNDHTLRPVHAHINLLGWATMVLTGVIYQFFPRAGASRLARVHFWLYQIALPVDMFCLGLMFKGHTGIMPVLGVSTTSVVLAVALFVINVLRHRS